MSVQKGALVVMAAAVVALTGCFASTKTTQPSGTPAVQSMGAAQHNPPEDVVVYLDTAAKQATPYTAYLDSPSQKLHWITSDGSDFVVNFIKWPAGKKQLPDQASGGAGNSKGHAVLTGVKSGAHTGEHQYKVIVTLAGGQTIEIDPIIIVTY